MDKFNPTTPIGTMKYGNKIMMAQVKWYPPQEPHGIYLEFYKNGALKHVGVKVVEQPLEIGFNENGALYKFNKTLLRNSFICDASKEKIILKKRGNRYKRSLYFGGWRISKIHSLPCYGMV